MKDFRMKIKILKQYLGNDINNIDESLHIKITDAMEDYAKRRVDENSISQHISYWVAFDWNKPETIPIKYGKYLVRRKDGKIHWETWNGTGWSYNGNVITHWMEVKPPCS